MSCVLFAKNQGCTSRRGHTGSSKAEHAAVRVPPAQLHSSDTDQNVGAAAIFDSNHPILAQQTMDGGASAAPSRPWLLLLRSNSVSLVHSRFFIHIPSDWPFCIWHVRG